MMPHDGSSPRFRCIFARLTSEASRMSRIAIVDVLIARYGSAA